MLRLILLPWFWVCIMDWLEDDKREEEGDGQEFAGELEEPKKLTRY